MIASPAGKSAAAFVVGRFVPETEYAKSVATYAMAEAGEEMTGDDCGPEKIVSESEPKALPSDVDAERETAVTPAEAGVPVI